MPTASTVYERAATRAQTDWTPKEWYGKSGGGCLVGVVLLELGNKTAIDNQTLPSEPCIEIHSFLRRHSRSYRRISADTMQERIVKWNDADGRTKMEVVNVLRGLAHQMARAENVELRERNAQLEAEVAELRAALTGNVDHELRQLTVGVSA